jgi:hypothetical protein
VVGANHKRSLITSARSIAACTLHGTRWEARPRALRQSRRRGCRARARGRLYAPLGQFGERHQREAQREAQLQPHPRYRGVASAVRMPQVMEVNPSFQAKTVLEFIARAKANSGKRSRDAMKSSVLEADLTGSGRAQRL